MYIEVLEQRGVCTQHRAECPRSETREREGRVGLGGRARLGGRRGARHEMRRPHRARAAAMRDLIPLVLFGFRNTQMAPNLNLAAHCSRSREIHVRVTPLTGSRVIYNQDNALQPPHRRAPRCEKVPPTPSQRLCLHCDLLPASVLALYVRSVPVSSSLSLYSPRRTCLPRTPACTLVAAAFCLASSSSCAAVAAASCAASMSAALGSWLVRRGGADSARRCW